ncbi:hypothetical protein [Hoeflea sp.]|uniref:hypothetical protein n=1 Tax=Hoeflea sp. TaxID=1940281 RepID=UPI0019BCEFA2|nr:hypothetical protein [Hoeflea sp.]MBC7281441.1 hypothetical protein [Hoeflea sp.]
MSNSKTHTLSIEDVLAETDHLISAPDAELEADAAGTADRLLAMGEAVLVAWHDAHGNAPTGDKVEGFRMLALHRQAARGNPTFNACRETCREVVYHHNLIRHDPEAPGIARTIRLAAMVVRHLALFVGGKLENAGLGDFCCSSRPVRQAEALPALSETP